MHAGTAVAVIHIGKSFSGVVKHDFTGAQAGEVCFKITNCILRKVLALLMECVVVFQSNTQ